MRLLANGLQIEVDDQGPASGRPLLLVMGLGMQLIAWPDALVAALVQQGFRVIRFDNRDIGLSQGFDEHGVPNMALAGLRYAMRLRVLEDRTTDEVCRELAITEDNLFVRLHRARRALAA